MTPRACGASCAMTPRAGAASRATGHAEAGASLVELLVAVALLSLALGTVAMLATAVLAGFEADPAAADEQQRARSGINALLDDVQRAGSGFVQSADDAPGSALPSLVPDVVSPGAWAARAVPYTLTTVHGRRGAAHATLRAPAMAGDVWIRLARPAFCSAVSVSCGFAAGDDVMLFDAHGRFALAAVRQVAAPLDLELGSPLSEPWRAGAAVSAIVAHSYGVRADAATGLAQLVRRLGAGPANPVIDFVTRFDVAWHAGPATPTVRVATDGTLGDATAGPRPPPSGTVAAWPWPAGENCAYARDAADTPVWRGGAGPVPLAALDDGPWCPWAGGAVAVGSRSGPRAPRHGHARRGRGVGAAAPAREPAARRGWQRACRARPHGGGRSRPRPAQRRAVTCRADTRRARRDSA